MENAKTYSGSEDSFIVDSIGFGNLVYSIIALVVSLFVIDPTPDPVVSGGLLRYIIIVIMFVYFENVILSKVAKRVLIYHKKDPLMMKVLWGVPISYVFMLALLLMLMLVLWFTGLLEQWTGGNILVLYVFAVLGLCNFLNYLYIWSETNKILYNH